MHKGRKRLFTGPQNHHSNHTTLPTAAHKTSCTYTHFWKSVISNPVYSTEATRGSGRVSGVYYRPDQHICV